MRTTTAATIVIWLAGMGSASALVYSLTRPLVPAARVEEKDARPLTTAEAPASAGQASVVAIAPVEIVATRPRPPRRAALDALPRRARDLTEMRCSAPKPLATGPIDQTVRYCE